MYRYCQVARQIVYGPNIWGDGLERRRRLTEAGFNWKFVQYIINMMIVDPTRRVSCYIK